MNVPLPLPLMPFLIILLLWPIKGTVAQARPANCTSKCGNVTIPFPFGIEIGCSIDSWFKVDCNSSKPYLRSINMELLDISLLEDLLGSMQVSSSVYNTCATNISPNGAAFSLDTTPFIISPTRNKFLGVGCGGFTAGNSGADSASCSTSCQQNSQTGGDHTTHCQDVVQFPMKRFSPSVNGSGCSYAVLVEQQWSDNNLQNPEDVRNFTHVPVLLEWSIFSASFDKFAINKSKAYESSSSCLRSACSCFSNESPTVQCHCLPGFEGNPYLLEGCRDTCQNGGGPNCIDLPGRKGSNIKLVMLGIGISLGSLLLFMGLWWLYTIMKKKKEIQLKEKYFKRNGGLLLQQQLTSFDDNVDKSKLFTSKELDKATDHFNENRILGQGGQGTVFKGMLTDGRIVAVKKSKIVDAGKLGEFINEVVMLSQINHRNVVKLLGCCLETEVPLLVYEFIPNGTLFQYLHEQNDHIELPFTWEMRLRIATEVAWALSYLHSAAAVPIYHRDIKSSNILLDEKYFAKVADFGTSRSIPIDHTHVTTKVQGTFGYFDPEYFRSNQFTDKSDVYSFGVVLIELLTGRKPIFSEESGEVRNLASYFIVSMEEDKLYEALDAKVVEQGKKEEIMAIANLAKRCLNLSGKKRPTMKEVAMELERVRGSSEKLIGNNFVEQNYEEFDYMNCDWDVASSSGGSTLDSCTVSVDVNPLLAKRLL